MIKAEIILDSVNDYGDRITTFELTFHRFILPEFNTHRAFSRNLASSRAIPIEKMIDQVERNPAYPIFWGKNQKGMQAKEQLYGKALRDAIYDWECASESAVEHAKNMNKDGAHKQLVNRILEPFLWCKAVMTTCHPGIENFLTLRDHEDAQPEIQALAKAMLEASSNSTPQHVPECGWHIPYILEDDQQLPIQDKLVLSAARCASVSYKTVDDTGILDLERAHSIWDKLINSKPAHASPVEHQAQSADEYTVSRNFVGWTQHREVLGL